MPPVQICQTCSEPATPERLNYARGSGSVQHEALLQCDICERYACSRCLAVYDVYSGYDFLCRTCAQNFPQPPPTRPAG